MSDQHLLNPGDEFEKYTVVRELGHGGMGAVFLVRHRVLDTDFALKVLYPEVAKRNQQFVERFIREARLAGNIRHQNLIAVYDAGQNEKNGMYYLVMDYVAGGSVRDKLKQNHYLGLTEAVAIIRQVASALEAAQERNMVHRDIKPDNIMFDSNGVVRLADLGIAKASDGRDTNLTVEASVFGTPSYMSPEQARDASKVDTRADIYSLGVVFYEMLTGRRPFVGENNIEILTQVIDGKSAPDVRTYSPELPEDVARLVMDMLEKTLAKRVASPTELIRRLDALDLSGYEETEQADNAKGAAMSASAPPSAKPGEQPQDDPEVTMPTMVGPIQTPGAAPPAPPPAPAAAPPAPPASAAPAAAPPATAKVDLTQDMTEPPAASVPSAAQDGAGKGQSKGKGKVIFLLVLILAFLVLGGVVAALKISKGSRATPVPGEVLTEKTDKGSDGIKPDTPPTVSGDGGGLTEPTASQKTLAAAGGGPVTPVGQEAQKPQPPKPQPPVVADGGGTAAPAGQETQKPPPKPQPPVVADGGGTAAPAGQETQKPPQPPAAKEEPPPVAVAVVTTPSSQWKSLGNISDGTVVVFGEDNSSNISLYKYLETNGGFDSVAFRGAASDVREWVRQLGDILASNPAFVAVVVTNEKNTYQFRSAIEGIVKLLPSSSAVFLVNSGDMGVFDAIVHICTPVGMYVRKWGSNKELTAYIQELKQEQGW